MHLPPLRAGGVATLAFVALALAASACGGDNPGKTDGGMASMQDAPEGAIRVDLVNWAVKPAQASIKAGEVTFWAVHTMEHMHGENEGGATHDLQVMKRGSDGALSLVGQVQGLRMGDAESLTLTLEPGEYELACNVVEKVGDQAIGHYAKGMHATFTVTA